MRNIGASVLVCAVILVTSGSVCAQTPLRYLLKVDVEDHEETARLVRSGICVVQDLGKFTLVRAGISDIALLNSWDYNSEILDSDWGYADHYIVSLKRCPDPEGMGRVVYSDEKLAVVRMNATPLGLSVYHDAKKLRTFPVKLRDEGRNLSFLPDTIPDPLIQQMVDSVNSDTVESYLRSLEGIGTRYSPTPGCSLAAEYIKAKFEAYGLSAVLQPYGLSGMAYDICIVDDSVCVAVDELGGIHRSVDGGVNWGRCYTHSRPLLGVCFATPLLGWAVGGDTVLHTTDGGISWHSQAASGALQLFRCFFIDSLHGWSSGAAPDTTPAVYRTTDGGESWAQSGLPLYGEFLGISFTDTMRGWTTFTDGGAGGCEIYNTTDGGVTWSSQYDSLGVVLFGVSFYDSLKGWAVGGDVNTGNALLVATTDGGQNWSPRTAGGLILGDIDFVDSLNGWCVGLASIKRTTDGGYNWYSQIPPDMQFFISLDMDDTLHGVCAGSNGTIGSTVNSGTTWLLSNTGGQLFWYNVEAELPGVDMPDEIYIVCGHHDDISEDPFNVAPGADDNASGVACVLEAARVLSGYQFHRTIRFVTFSGEEQGMVGSRVYATRADSLGDNIMGVLNLDMIGYLDDANYDLDIYTDLASEWLADTILRFSAEYVPTLIPYKEVDPTMVYSDHSSFWDVGYSAVLDIERAFVNWNPYYHSSRDTVGTLVMPYVRDMVKLGLASVAELADPYVVGVAEAPGRRTDIGRLALSISGSPFRERIKLSVLNTTSAEATLEIYDASGRLFRRFEPLNGERMELWWEGFDGRGREASSGVYIARLSVGSQTDSKKMVLVR